MSVTVPTQPGPGADGEHPGIDLLHLLLTKVWQASSKATTGLQHFFLALEIPLQDRQCVLFLPRRQFQAQAHPVGDIVIFFSEVRPRPFVAYTAGKGKPDDVSSAQLGGRIARALITCETV